MSLRNHGIKRHTNNVGTEAFKVSDDDRFIRALTIGADYGTFYVGKDKLSKDVVEFIESYIATNPGKAVAEIINVSSSGRAPKNTHCVFALSVAYASDDPVVKKVLASTGAFAKVVRTTFDLTEFVSNLDALGSGWGRAKRNAVASWYESKSSDSLAYQAVKYRSRGGYTHRDLMRLSHPKIEDGNLANFILTLAGAEREVDTDKLPQVAINYLSICDIDSAGEAVSVIKDSQGAFAWEFLRTELLNDKGVWTALLEGGHVKYMALMRNMGRFNKIGLFDDEKTLEMIKSAITDRDAISKSRIHPMHILNAIRGASAVNQSFYSSYCYEENDMVSKVSKSLEEALEVSFGNVEPTGKAISLGVDVSGSMSWAWDGYGRSNMNSPTPRMIASMLSAMILRSEEEDMVDVFAFSDNLVRLDVDKNTKFTSFMSKTNNMPFGGTDASLQFKRAIMEGKKYDAFITVTDNDTYMSIDKDLAEYRKKVNPDAKLIVIAITGGDFSVNDPRDPNGLDVSGLDASSISYVMDFIAGRV